MVAPTTSTNGQVIDLTDHDPLVGRLEWTDDGTWRWDCALCPGRSIGTWTSMTDAWEALKRHHDAAKETFHR